MRGIVSTESSGGRRMELPPGSMNNSSRMQTFGGEPAVNAGSSSMQPNIASRRMEGSKEAAAVKNQGSNPQEQSREALNKEPVRPQTDPASQQTRAQSSYTRGRDEVLPSFGKIII